MVSKGRLGLKIERIERRRLGQQVLALLTDKIMDGSYEAGFHLSEIHLCRELAVSRTPVREALFKLEEKGLVVSHPNRGFFVASHDPAKVLELYPVLANLEVMALTLSEAPSEKDIKALAKINQQINRPPSSKQFQLDKDFHALLISSCPNKELLAIIAESNEKVSRFDGGLKRGLANPELAYREHLTIIDAVKAGDMGLAAKRLIVHWNSGIETVTQWIENEKKVHNHG